jgi:hypothetical protein
MRRPSCVLVRPDHRRVDPNVEGHVVGITSPLQLSEQLLPRPIGRPPAVPVVGGLPRPVLGRQIAPRRTSPRPPQHSIDNPAVIAPPATSPPRCRGRQVRLDQCPLLIGQIMSIAHTDTLAHLLPRNCGTRPSAPATSKTAGQRPLLSQEGPLNLPTRDQIRDRNRPRRSVRRRDGAGEPVRSEGIREV